MDEVLRMPIDKALVIIRGQKVLQVDKYDYSLHPESKYLQPCKASAHLPEWRKQQAHPFSASSASSAEPTTPKSSRRRKPKAADGQPSTVRKADKRSIMDN